MIPPAWQGVWISPRSGAKLQATGIDSAGRRQYLYQPDFRANARGVCETETEAKRAVAVVMRRVAERLGNTRAVARASYVSLAVIEQCFDGRAIEDFRPRHLRVVGARELGLNPEEQSLLSLLRSWRIRRVRLAA